MTTSTLNFALVQLTTEAASVKNQIEYTKVVLSETQKELAALPKGHSDINYLNTICKDSLAVINEYQEALVSLNERIEFVKSL